MYNHYHNNLVNCHGPHGDSKQMDEISVSTIFLLVLYQSLLQRN